MKKKNLNLLAAAILVITAAGCAMPGGMHKKGNNSLAPGSSANKMAAKSQLPLSHYETNVSPSQTNPGNFPLDQTPVLASFALSKQDVRVVPFKNIVENIKNPIIPPPPRVKLTVIAGPNGSTSPSGEKLIFQGMSYVINAIPNPGYRINTATRNGQPIEFVKNRYTTGGIMIDCTIELTFIKIDAITIKGSARSGPNGRLIPEGEITVEKGAALQVEALPDPGYEIDTALLNGAPVIFVNNLFTINNIEAEFDLYVTFKPINDPYEVTYEITQDWGTGFGGKVTIINNSAVDLNTWQVVWTYTNDVQVTGLWNGNFLQTGKTVTVDNLSWNAVIPANGGKVNFGFNGTYAGENEIPTGIKLLVQ